MRIRHSILAVFFLVQALSGCAGSFTQKHGELKSDRAEELEEEILYKSENGRNVDVFNLKELWFSQEGVEYVSRRDFQYGEFGGQMEFCSNQDYYCLGGGLNVAVPKNINGQKEWQFKERDCQAITPLSRQRQTTIICSFKGHSKEFTYSPDRGIVSYSYGSQSNGSYKYKLVGEKGLFAP